MKKIAVQLRTAPYEVLVGPGLLKDAARHILRALPSPPTRFVVVTSPQIEKLWCKSLLRSLQQSGVPVSIVRVGDGERHKNLQTLQRLLAALARCGADRGSCVVAFGGGVIGDMAGFAAASYMRGIRVVQIPTTLLAQVDAAIGGKTGVNLAEGKNLVGALHQPSIVIADTECLRTLSEREFRAGLFEVLKCGFIRDRALHNFMREQRQEILRRRPQALLRVISAAVRVKANVVAADEKEADLRRILNYGHTVGHALEAATRYKRLLHGEAVALGMMAAAEIAAGAGVCSERTAEEIIELTASYLEAPRLRVSPARLWPLLFADKKTVAGIPHFVLVPKIGEAVIKPDVPPAVIKQALRSVCEVLERA